MGYICPICFTENDSGQTTCRVCRTRIPPSYLFRERRMRRPAPPPRVYRWYGAIIPRICAFLLLICLLLLPGAMISSSPGRMPDRHTVIGAYTGGTDAFIHAVAPNLMRHIARLESCAESLNNAVCARAALCRHQTAAVQDRALCRLIDLHAGIIPSASGAIALRIQQLSDDLHAADPESLLRALTNLYR